MDAETNRQKFDEAPDLYTNHLHYKGKIVILQVEKSGRHHLNQTITIKGTNNG